MISKKERAPKRYIGDKKKEMDNWLKGALRASNADWKMVHGHHPMKLSKDDGSLKGSNFSPVPKLMDQYGVPIWLSGHHHHQEVMQKGKNTWVISGSGAQSGYGSRSPRKKDVKHNSRGGGFMSIHFCSKSSAHLKVYDQNGNEKTKVSVPNLGSSRSSINDADANDDDSSDDIVDDVEDEEEAPPDVADDVPWEPDAKVEPWAGESSNLDESVTCAGKLLPQVKGTCGGDPCRVMIEEEADVSCKDYCESHGLTCSQAWTQTEEEDCTPAEKLGCDAVVEDAESDYICQCS